MGTNKTFEYHECNDYDLIDAKETHEMVTYLVENLKFPVTVIAREAGVSRTNVKSLYDGIKRKKDGKVEIYCNKYVYGKMYKKLYQFYDRVVTKHIHPNDLVKPNDHVDAKLTKQIINQLLRMGYSRSQIALGANIKPDEVCYILLHGSSVRQKTFLRIVNYAKSIIEKNNTKDDKES